MPIKIPDDLPAVATLERENMFLMPEERAVHQDIRALRILILNLMPDKIETETQILRLLGNSPLQVDIELLHPVTHESKNTSSEHLIKYYKTFNQVKNEKFDGMIITGAPVEHLEFNEVDYWDELVEIMDWSNHNVFSTFYICWGAQAGLYHFYGIPKYNLPAKMFGVFAHYICKKHTRLLRGFDDKFYVPHSRHTEIRREDIINEDRLELLSYSSEAGVYIAVSKDQRRVFVTGHSEYNEDTLKGEYERDLKSGMNIEPPRNYFPADNPEKDPVVKWRSHANLLYANWLNYYVYQETPYDLSQIE